MMWYNKPPEPPPKVKFEDYVPPPDYSDLLDDIASNLSEINDTLNSILRELENKKSNEE